MKYAERGRLVFLHQHPQKYVVRFTSLADGSVDYYPDVHAGEKPFDTVDEASEDAEEFAAATVGMYCNINIALWMPWQSCGQPVENWTVWNKKDGRDAPPRDGHSSSHLEGSE